MNPVDLAYRGNKKSRVLVGETEETRKAVCWLDSLKRREKQCVGQPEETRKAVFLFDSIKRREKQGFGWTA
jgi:hypothetical protein